MRKLFGIKAVIHIEAEFLVCIVLEFLDIDFIAELAFCFVEIQILCAITPFGEKGLTSCLMICVNNSFIFNNSFIVSKSSFTWVDNRLHIITCWLTAIIVL